MDFLNIFLAVLAVVLVLVGLITLGFALVPRPFRPHPAPSQPGAPAPYVSDLPEPVRRHFLETIGETPPRIHSAVVWGRGKSCMRGVWIPLRYKAWYRPGEAFMRRMEFTFFRRPVLRGNEKYLHGEGMFRVEQGIEDAEEADQNEVLSLWAEMVWMPSVFVHYPLLHWEPVDEHTARLVVPTAENHDSLMAHFDPLTGRMTHFTAFRISDESGEKEPWRVDLLTWKSEQGMLIPGEITVGWGESGSPVSYWTIDGVAYNVHVSDQLGEPDPAAT